MFRLSRFFLSSVNEFNRSSQRVILFPFTSPYFLVIFLRPLKMEGASDKSGDSKSVAVKISRLACDFSKGITEEERTVVVESPTDVVIETEGADCFAVSKSAELLIVDHAGDKTVVECSSEVTDLSATVLEQSLSSDSFVVNDSEPKLKRPLFRKGKSRQTNKHTNKQTDISLPPNYFVAVPVSNLLIRKAASRVQQGIVESCPQLEPALVSLDKLHITLMVLRLDSEADIERAHFALEACVEKVGALEPDAKWPTTLPFHGLSHFKNQVLYVDPAPSDGLTRLHRLAECVEDRFLEQNLVSVDKKSKFTPHVTLMKLSKLRRGGIKKIPVESYEVFEKVSFGEEVLDRIQLCSMLLPKDEKTGYYFCSKEVKLSN